MYDFIRMILTTFIGYIATFVTVIAFVPQVTKAWKSKQTKDISLRSYVLLISATIFWLVYGFLIMDIPILITNACLFCLQCTVIILKFKHG